MRRVLFISVLMLAVAAPASAQLGKLGQAVGKISKAKSMADQVKDLVVTEQEEKDMGAAISTRLRQKYGVVQDAGVHKYVSLVGRVVASSSTRPNLS